MVVMSSALPQSPAHTSFRSLQRQLAALLPPDAESGFSGDPTPLEVTSATMDPPHLVSATVIEGGPLRARRVAGDPEVGFAAFLDGTQRSVVLAHHDGVPIVGGTIGAAIRIRRNSRLATWRHRVETRVYAPRRFLSADSLSSLDRLAADVVDTTADDLIAHPYAVREAAIHKVQDDREAAEHRLAEEWSDEENAPLFADGGISANDRIARAEGIVGVVKSHRTLYADGDALRTVLRLGVAERSSVFRVTPRKRTSVASWYLRLRDPTDHDPMWGLVRVEIAEPRAASDAEIGARADQVSRWILAEVAPLALPDGRWDKMVYGIRDCEEFLRAVM
jgi:hypothetical protein